MADSTIKSVFVCLASVTHQILVNQIAFSELLAKELPGASEESRRMLVTLLEQSKALCGVLDDVGSMISMLD